MKKFFCMILFFCSFNLLANDTIHFSFKGIKYKISVVSLKEHLHFETIPRTVPYSGTRLLRYGRLNLLDSITILNTFPPTYISLDEITWKENPFNNETWKLYYENLLFVSILNHCYIETKDLSFYNKAKSFIKSYIVHHQDFSESTSSYTWYDHSCAFRTLHILQTIAIELCLEKPDIPFIETCFNHIMLNAEFMVDKNNYHNYNHSLMMDVALLFLSKAIVEEKELSDKFMKIALQRSTNLFSEMVDESGLAKEHSITYHIFNHNLYKKIFDVIPNQIPTETRLRYLKMNDILLLLLKPNGTFPLWGDSQKEILSDNLINEFGNDKRLLAAKTNYNLESEVNFNNGIGVLRSQTPDSTYIAFFCNYMGKVHKHMDDLSFVLTTCGTDVFIDPGYYGYDKKYRPFLISSLAHNTLTINDSSYGIGKNGQYSKIYCYEKKDNYEKLCGEHNFYGNSIIRRNLFYIKPNVIILFDNVIGKKNNYNFSQVFNIGKEALHIDEDYNIKINFPDSLIIEIKQSSNEITHRVFYGDTINIRGFISERPYKLSPIYQLEYSQTDSIFSTIIIMKSPKFKHPINKVNIQKTKIMYRIDNKWFNIRY